MQSNYDVTHEIREIRSDVTKREGPRRWGALVAKGPFFYDGSAEVLEGTYFFEWQSRYLCSDFKTFLCIILFAFLFQLHFEFVKIVVAFFKR